MFGISNSRNAVLSHDSLQPSGLSAAFCLKRSSRCFWLKDGISTISWTGRGAKGLDSGPPPVGRGLFNSLLQSCFRLKPRSLLKEKRAITTEQMERLSLGEFTKQQSYPNSWLPVFWASFCVIMEPSVGRLLIPCCSPGPPMPVNRAENEKACSFAHNAAPNSFNIKFNRWCL